MPSETIEMPRLEGIHHLKIPVSDLDRSLLFYENAFGARRLARFDHRRSRDDSLYAYILEIPGVECMVELRLDAAAAAQQKRFDPVTFAVADLASLQRWELHLTRRGVTHSPIITAIVSWLMVIEDPDQHRLRLYSLATHGRELTPDEDNPWLAPG